MIYLGITTYFYQYSHGTRHILKNCHDFVIYLLANSLALKAPGESPERKNLDPLKFHKKNKSNLTADPLTFQRRGMQL